MFDKTYNPRDEICFSLFKFKVPKCPRPACDWQYVIHTVEVEQESGFRGRLVSAEDCRQEYDRWTTELAAKKAD